MFCLRRPELDAALSARPCHERCTLPALVAVAGLLFLRCASAQGPVDGAVYGVLRSRDGHPAAAQITLRSVDGYSDAGSATVPSGADGSFLLPHLAPGGYTLVVRLPLGPVLEAGPFEVVQGETVEVRATLAAAGGLAIASEAGSGDNGGSTDHESDPTTDLAPDENDDGLSSAHGLTTMQTEASIDGITATQSYSSVPVGTGRDPEPDPDGDADSAERTSGPANGLGRGRHAGVTYVFAQSSVREFRQTANSYSAQTGHGGGVVTTVSRAGTGQLHGAAFFTLRSQALAARSPLAIATNYANGAVSSMEVKPHDLREDFGATLAGPVPRARGLVFLYTIARQVRGFPAISSPTDPNFYNLTPTQRALLGTRGVTTAAVNTALNYVSSLTGETPRRADQTLNFVRFDWSPRERWAAAVEYNGVRWSSPAGLIDAPVVARGRASLGTASGSLDAAGLRLTANFSRRTINQARVAYVRDGQYEMPQAPLAQEPAISPGGLAPEVNIGPNGLLFGTPATLSKQAYPDERRVQFADTMTLVRGHHLLEFGGELSLVNDAVATLGNAAGTFRYDSGTTGGFAGGLVDFITDYTFNVNAYPNGGCPRIMAAVHLFCFRSFSQSFGEQSVAFSTTEAAGFVEDTWRPRAGLSIHAGVRYEYTLLPLPQKPNAALDAAFGSRGATSVFPEDRNNFGPRAAVAYEPFGTGRLLVRVGFGMFFGRVPGATIQSALSDTAQASATTRVRIWPSATVSCPQSAGQGLGQGFGYPCAFSTVPAGVVAASTSAMVFDHRFRLPVIEQGSLSLERDVLPRTRVTATYVFNLDRQLPGSTDINIASATATGVFQLHGGTGAAGVQDGETFRLPLYTSRVNAGFGPVTDIISNVNATYDGLTLAVDSEPRRGLRVNGSATWSKAIDFGQNRSATPRTNGQFDPYTHGYDKGLSALNYPLLLRVATVWTPAVRTGAAWMRRVVNGWEVAPVVAARSGRAYSFDLSGGTYLPGGHESLNGSGGALYLPTVGRNTLRLPEALDVDLRVGRGFAVRRKGRGYVSAEVYNLLNHQNISSVSQRAYLVGTPVAGVTPLTFQDAATISAEGVNTQPFGTPTAASTSLNRERRVQLSLRVEF